MFSALFAVMFGISVAPRASLVVEVGHILPEAEAEYTYTNVQGWMCSELADSEESYCVPSGYVYPR